MIARKRHGRANRGFTLVELLVSMAAGIMVSLAVVSLSREASNSFHEETRIASAEMQIRSATDRLRADLQRASYMSTGNIWIDPSIRSINSPVGATTNVAAIPNGFYSSTSMSLGSLAGVRLCTDATGCSPTPVASSVASTATSQVNGLAPQAIELGGYFTSVEQLAVGGGTGTTAVLAGGACNGQIINLDVNSSPAIWRLVGLGVLPADAGVDSAVANYDTTINAAFQPVAGAQFIVRVTDNTGKSQFAATCANTAAAWNNGSPQVYIDPLTPIDLAAVGGTNATINPVQIVRWAIEPAVITDTTPGTSPKYDLTRSFVDATGTVTATKEVVAEYAVDLKFAFTVDDTSDVTGNNLNGAGSNLQVYSFEDVSSNTKVADDPKSIGTGANGPQRIRSIRFRVTTRVPTPDRSEPLSAGSDYVYRYCTGSVATDCVTGNPVFARTRTLISEVALPNQARFWYR